MYSVSHSFPNFSVSRVFSVPLHSLPWAVSQPGKFISVPSSSLMLRLYRAGQCQSLGCCDAHKPTGSCCFLHWGNLGCLGAPEMWVLFCFLFLLFFSAIAFFCCFPSMNGAFTRFHLGLPLSVLWPWSQIPQKQLKEPSVRRFLSMG